MMSGMDSFCVLAIGCCFVFFFFFQAEDGIRDLTVTGVQTCALPIFVSAADNVPIVAMLFLVPFFTWLGIKQAKAKDRKSTRLNSSHSQISYAVFCLKKKTTDIIQTR